MVMPTVLGNTILAEDYNAIQTRVARVLGSGGFNFSNTPDPSFGYGQTVTSTQVAVGNIVTASQLNNLKQDLQNIGVKQTNTTNDTGASVSIGNVITAAHFNNLWNGINTLGGSPNRFRLAVEQAAVITSFFSPAPVLSAPGAGWNGSRVHTVKITFKSSNHARWFFNSGSCIQMTPTHVTNGETKSTRWQTLLNSIGINGVRLGANGTTATGGTAQTAIGWYQLTTVPQTIFTIEMAAGQVYSGNDYTVTAFKNSFVDATELTITMSFNDDTSNTGTIDENVKGTTTSNIGAFIAKSGNGNPGLPSNINVPVNVSTSTQPGVYNPIVRPINGIEGQYEINVQRPITISIIGGPPNITCQVTRTANKNGMFSGGYVANTTLTDTITFDANGYWSDNTYVFPVTGTVNFTLTIPPGSYTILNGNTRTYTVTVGTNFPEPTGPTNPTEVLDANSWISIITNVSGP